MKPIFLQLYSVREACSKDLKGTLKKVKDAGYEGVELAGLYGLAPGELKALLKELGLKSVSGHFNIAPDAVMKSIGEAKALGLKWIVGGFGPDRFKTMKDVEASAAQFNEASRIIKENGLGFAMHNHWWEFEERDGQLVFDTLRKLCPDLKFELDVYWASNFGAHDPAEILRRNAKCIPLVHIKDGPLERDKRHCAVGKGRMDVKKVVAECGYRNLECMIVEIDSCDGDMLEAVCESFSHLDALRK